MRVYKLSVSKSKLDRKIKKVKIKYKYIYKLQIITYLKCIQLHTQNTYIYLPLKKLKSKYCKKTYKIKMIYDKIKQIIKRKD